VNEHRFLNMSQPQTLYSAVILCYISVLFNLLGRRPDIFVPIALVLAVSAYGIANEKKWGYSFAVGASVLQVLMLFAVIGSAALTQLGGLIDLIWYGALVGLLLHPMSRDYQRIWFR
jgi:hypothetical protein